MKYRYDAEVTNVVDGDTMDVKLDLGFNISKTVRVRLNGVDTNEIFGVPKDSEEYEKGIAQKKFVEDFAYNSNALIVETLKDDTGKYGRYLARIRRKRDDNTLADYLVDEFKNLEKTDILDA